MAAKGKWVGMIVDAPGATAAALASGVTKHAVTNSGTLNVDNDSKITNNINLAAQSGDASVTGNTKAGNAKSGDASASANIVNISRSTFNLTGWFRILFINVDNDWIGRFAVDDRTGEVTPLSGAAINGASSSPSAPNLRFGFIPQAPSAQTTNMIMRATGGDPPVNEQLPQDVQAVLASAKLNDSTNSQLLGPVATAQKVVADPLAVFMMVSGGLIAFAPLGLSLFRRRGALLATLRARV